MKNRTRGKSIICILIISIVFLLTTKVNAQNDSFQTSLSVNNTQAKAGESIIVTLALSNIAIESGEKGIGAYTAYIDFDSSILEYVDTDGTDEWEAPFYQNGYIVGNTGNGEVVKTAQSIGTITFKVKENAKLGETTIKLTKFSGSTAATEVATEDSAIRITIVGKEEENGSQGGNGTQAGGQSQGGSGAQSGNTNQGGSGNVGGNPTSQNGGTTNSGSSSYTDNTNKPGTLPQTGKSNIAIFLTISILVLLAIGLVLKIRLLNKKK